MYSDITIQDLVKWTGGKLFNCANPSEKITSISTDTRTLKKGEVFAAVRGENFDGHKFLTLAGEKGAQLLITEEKAEKPFPQIIVENSLQALAAIAKNLRKKFPGLVVAITGSAGKSSTKEMVATLLGENTLKNPASFNNLLGVSKTLFLIENSTKKAVLEMGMSGFFEIKELCENFEPNIGLITNIGDAHMGELGGQEGIYLAKKEMFDWLASNPLTQGVALNLDDALVVKAYKECFKKYKQTVTYSLHTNANADITLINQEIDPQTAFLKLTVKIYKEYVDVSLPIFGLHQSGNLLAAISAALLTGSSVEEIKPRLNNIRPASHRGEIVLKKNGIVLIDESYNSNPTALRSSLQSLAQVPWKDRLVIVIGQMNALASFSEEKHREAGEQLLKNFSNRKNILLVAVGKDCAPLVKAVSEKNPGWEIKTFENISEIKPVFENLLKPKDLVYIKASNAIKLYELT